MNAADWRALGAANARLAARAIPLKLCATLAGIMLFSVTLAYAHHQGVVAGRVSVELAEAKAQSEMYRKAVQVLLPKVKQQDSVIKDKARNFTKTVTLYKTSRDAVLKPAINTHPEKPNPDLGIMDTVAVMLALDAADSALAAADSVIAAKDVAISLRDSVIEAQSAQIGTLNRQIKLTIATKPSRFSRMANAAKWASAGVVVGMAIKR